ncbi:MAG: hypothetical protein IJR68_08040 [Fretibacterium sp.]|jgi:hypothetical protein|nr:hypothetical protein [Fretibacterium sp.]
MKKFVNLFVFVALVVLCTGVAFAAEGDYILKDRQVYRVDGGKETLLEDEEAQWAGTDAGIWAMILVDPELSEEMKGSEAGIYFFRGEEAKPAGFLPMKNAGSCALEFSPSGEKVLISCGGEAKRQLGYYVIDAEKKTFTQKTVFDSAGRFFWLDPHRFVFGSVDEEKGNRMKDWQYRGNEAWWCSVAMYDTLEESATVFGEAAATETRNFVVTGIDEESGTMEIWEHFVKDAKDWEDEAKIEERDFRIPIPAAG